MQRLAFVSLLLVVTACGSKQNEPSSPSEAPKVSSGSPVETYFPLTQGMLYSYAVSDVTGAGAVRLRVERTDATHGKLVVVGSSKAQRFVFEKEGVANDGGGPYVLKTPIEVGNSWPGEHGGTLRITKTDATAEVAGRTYSSCVQTSEDATRPTNARYTTTYCPGVGMVLFEVVAEGADAKGQLLYYGPPIEMTPGTSVKIEKSQ